jgi:hypothetical protein
MRKIILAVTVLLTAFTSNISAQTVDDIHVSTDRIAKIQKLVDKKPKVSGVADVDKLVDMTSVAAAAAVAITPRLDSLYYRSIGKTQDGITDVTIKKPSLNECTALATIIGAEGVSLKEAGDLVAKATSSISTASMMQKIKGGKALNYAKDELELVGGESIYHAKAIQTIIQTIKTGKNL